MGEPVDLASAVAAVKAGVDGVRFRRGGEIDGRLGQRQFAFGAAEHVIGVAGGDRLRQRLRIGEADILDRHADQAPRDEHRVLAGNQHAGEIIERRVRVGAAHRLVQGRDQVVVAVLRLVVDRRAALHRAAGNRPGRAPARRARPHRPPPSAPSSARPSPSAKPISVLRRRLVERQRRADQGFGPLAERFERLRDRAR